MFVRVAVDAIKRRPSIRYVPAILLLMGFLLTMERAPVAWIDEVIYASTAWDLTIHGSGVPSIVRGLPGAIDHQAFYGPVFFQLARTNFGLFGLSIWSFRIICLAGALLIAFASAGIARAFGGSAGRQAFAFTVLLLTPELGAAATNGRMDALAVGFGLLALAVLLPTFISGAPARWRAPVAGTLLALSALTTPRAYPMVGASLLAAAAFWWLPLERRRPSFIAIGQAAAVLLLLVLSWATVALGSPQRWLQFMIAAGMGTPEDVMLAPNAGRWWTLMPWSAITPLFSTIAAISAVALLSRNFRKMPRPQAVTAVFMLVLVTLNVAVWLTTFNLTFVFGTYFALPLLAVVLALPSALLPQRRVIRHVAVALLLLFCVGIRAVKYVALAATWQARDPRPLERFIQAHVPAGSEVIGTEPFGFYAVERAGSRFRLENSGGQAGWADDSVSALAPPSTTLEENRRRARYLLRSVDDASDTDYPCALADPASLVATYEPPATRWLLPGSLRTMTGVPGYPRAALYRVPSDCHP